MKIRVKSILFLFTLLLCSCWFGVKPLAVSAEEVSVDKIAYVNPTEKRLVLKFKEFSSKDYTYSVKHLNTGKEVKKGTLKHGNGITKIWVSLGDAYKANNMYRLVIKSTTGKTLTVYYYTANTISDVKASTTAEEHFKTTWKVSNNTAYDHYLLKLCKSDDAPNSVFSKKTVKGDETSVSVSASSLFTYKYKYYLIGIMQKDGHTFYGKGLSGFHAYIRTPKKVAEVEASRKEDLVTLDWTPDSKATSYTILSSTSEKGTYSVLKSGIKNSSHTLYGLKNNRTYYFKVKAVATAGSTSKSGEASPAVKVDLPVMAGTASGLKFRMNLQSKFNLKWTAGNNADGYAVYVKDITAKKSYKKLGTTTSTSMFLTSLNYEHNYDIKVRSYRNVKGEKVYSSVYSPIVNVTPKTYISKNKNKMLAENVRSIGYSGNKCIYTTSKYPTAVKTAFVNYKKYSSKTKYLIWISHYTQQVTIFKGSKGKWKQIRTFTVATGKATTRSPRGVFKITYKEKGWFYVSTKELYVTHWKSRNSFHTRPLWNDGSVQCATIGKPASHGCVRCYNKDALYIYKNMPKNTTVVSY